MLYAAMFPPRRRYPNAGFHLFQSEALQSVGLAYDVAASQPFSPPRPFSINEVQASAVRLALVQYYVQRGWGPGMSEAELGDTCFDSPRGDGRGFVLGDGTGVGKTRELAAFALSLVLLERAVQELALRHCAGRAGAGRRAYPLARQPLVVWFTCSEPLFESCKSDMRAVLTNSDPSPEESWAPSGFPDAPGSFDPSAGLSTVDLDGREFFLRFLDLRGLKADEDLSRGLVSVPTVLFLTYAGLAANLETVLALLVGRGRPVMESRAPVAPVATALLCDEFHRPKAISDAFRQELRRGWERHDRAVLERGEVRCDAGRSSPASVVRRFCGAMAESQTAGRRKKRARRSDDPGASPESRFLAELGHADSFRLFVEMTKCDCFYLMSSATPFQSNEDLHSVDHIVRSVLPSYTSLPSFGCSLPDDDAAHLVDDREYATEFLEDLVKLLYHRGLFVSRAISLRGVECSVVRCPMSPLHARAFDRLASYAAEAKRALADSARLSMHLSEEIEKLAPPYADAGDPAEFRRRLDGLVERINGRRIKGPLSSAPPFFRVALFDDPELWNAGAAGGRSAAAGRTEEVFADKFFVRLANQFAVNVAALSVAVCKAALLSVKTRAVVNAIRRLRRSPTRKKVVVAVEQTGDAFLGGVVRRACDALLASPPSRRKLLRLCDFDASPAANAVLSLYRLLLQGAAVRSAVRVLPLADTRTCALLVPRLPPSWPLAAAGGNFLDALEQQVGECKHSEITNRKFKCRWSRNGMLSVRANAKSANTLKNVDEFNNNAQVDVMALGPRGNTGLSLHDSSKNAVAARRVHFVVDLPYSPVAFRQCVGRIHRNGQASAPAFLVFSTDAASERRFYDLLAARVDDSVAGSFGDRYSGNTLNVAAAGASAASDASDGGGRGVGDGGSGGGGGGRKDGVGKELFVDHGLALRAIGHVVRIVASDVSPLHLFCKLGSLGFYHAGRFVFVEGLDARNGLFLQTLAVGLNAAAFVLAEAGGVQEDRLALVRAAANAMDSDLVWSAAAAAACPGLAMAAERLSAAVNRPANVRMRDELLGGTQGGALREPRPGTPVITARVVGAGVPLPPNVMLAPWTVGEDVLNQLPLVAATCVLTTIAREYAALVPRILHSAAPHPRSWGKPTSFVLDAARRLVEGRINSKQFHNNYFSHSVDANLFRDLFAVVRHVLARDARMDALCDLRLNHMIAARFVRIGVPPGEHRGSYSVDVRLGDGREIGLTEQNSTFSYEYSDYFSIKHILAKGSVVQLFFDNHREFELPSRAMVAKTALPEFDAATGVALESRA